MYLSKLLYLFVRFHLLFYSGTACIQKNILKGKLHRGSCYHDTDTSSYGQEVTSEWSTGHVQTDRIERHNPHISAGPHAVSSRIVSLPALSHFIMD